MASRAGEAKVDLSITTEGGAATVGRGTRGAYRAPSQENPGSGFEKLQGELEKLGYGLGISTVRDVLRRHHIFPAPERDRTRGGLRTFLNHYRTQMLACDFFTAETVFCRRCTSCSSSSSAPGGCTWRASQIVPTRHGWLSKRSKWSGSFRKKTRVSGSSSMIGMPSSPARLRRCLPPKASRR